MSLIIYYDNDYHGFSLDDEFSKLTQLANALDGGMITFTQCGGNLSISIKVTQEIKSKSLHELSFTKEQVYILEF